MSERLMNLKGLIALNLALLAILALVSFAPPATAGGGGGAGASAVVGEYVMVGGTVQGSTSNAVYVLDQSTGTLIGLMYDRSTRRLRGLGIRNVKTDDRNVDPGR